MTTIVILVYCLVVACFVFGLTFRDELLKERKPERPRLIVIEGGKPNPHRLRRRV